MPKDVAFARAYYTEALPTGKIDPVTGGTYHKILHGASTSLTSGRSVIPLVSFAADADPSLKHKWTAMNDPVMGGKSYSNVSVGDDMLRFTGKVAIVPFLGAPGFITAATGRGLGPGGQSPLPPESFVDVSPARASPSLRTTSRTAIPATASPSATAMPSTQATTTRTASRQTSIRRSARSAGRLDPVHELHRLLGRRHWQIGRLVRGVREYCPDVKTLANMKTMSIWAEGVEGRVHLEVRSIA